MVLSKINSQVEYTEISGINPEDIGYESVPYELSVFGKSMVITLGKPKYSFSDKKIVYFPIYIVGPNNHIDAQIGIFEVLQNSVLKVYDEEGDVDIGKLNAPLYYKFAETQANNCKLSVEDYLHEWEKNDTPFDDDDDSEGEHDSNEENNSESGEEEDSPFNLGSPKTGGSSEKKRIDISLSSGPVYIDPEFHKSSMIIEEREEDARDIRKRYKVAPSHTWIQKYMKNDNYKIVEVETNGDCLFAVFRDALINIGRHTSVTKLRALVAREITDSAFQIRRRMFEDLDGEIKRNTSEMKRIKTVISPDLKRRAKAADKRGNKEEVKLIIAEGLRAKKRYEDLNREMRDTQDLVMDTLGDMKDVDTVEKFRVFVQTPAFWADEETISILERELKIKLIILSEDAFNDEDLTNVLMCAGIDKKIEKRGIFDPDYYIISVLGNSHYRLVSYKTKKILEFSEIPYQIKTLVVNKCMEANAGIFYLIQEFRDFKTRLGIDPDLGKGLSIEDREKYIYEGGSDGLFNSDATLMFYSRSNRVPYPGMGAGEYIADDKMHSEWRVKLGGKLYSNWRKKLDDEWTGSPFEIGGNRYMSVEHYFQGAKFKDGFPDFSATFAVKGDLNADINCQSSTCLSHNVDLAKIAGSTKGSGKLRGKEVRARPSKITIDPQFYPHTAKQAREEAVMAKFSQNQDMQNILILTGDAKLTHYIANNVAEPDLILMQVRRKLRNL
jgi:predicted NAD-dependent protein-ADP-ribosyltransferase YbiA (DUF1768 family)